MSDSTRINELRKEIEALCDNCDRPDKEELGKIILSSMTFGFSEGLKVPSADRPQGKWILFPMGYLVCSVCGSHHSNSKPCNYCDNCGAKMKGADDE